MRWDLIVAFWIGASWGAVLMAWWCSVAVVREIAPGELESPGGPEMSPAAHEALDEYMNGAHRLPPHVVEELADQTERRLRRAKDLAGITRGRAS